MMFICEMEMREKFPHYHALPDFKHTANHHIPPFPFPIDFGEILGMLGVVIFSMEREPGL